MLKSVNLLSIKSAKETLSIDVFDSYLKKNEIIVKTDEVDDLCSFMNYISPSSEEIKLFDSFYFGYKIQQISKEFDLLRIGEDTVINVELKRTQTVEKIKKQLIQNLYYLRFLGKKVINCTYISEENRIYFLTNEQELQEGTATELIQYFKEQKIKDIEDIDKLFKPTNYLVSPFNSTEAFIKGEYFLTQQQNEIKQNILENLNDKNSSYGIEGAAGTGKTLLTYDIAKYFIEEGKRVLLIHCGKLNEGHHKLKNDHSWEICSVKYLKNFPLDSYDLIIVDETQRIWEQQFDLILEAITNKNVRFILSYDPKQCLSDDETVRNIPLKVKEHLSFKVFKLTGKIRTNPEVAAFIKNILDLSKSNNHYKYDNINIQYFTNYEDAGNYANLLKEKDWNILSYTESRYTSRETDAFTGYYDLNAHQVVGQEFDKVATIIDSSFAYNEDNQLVSRGRYYYNPVGMLFQMLTRAREKICLIIVNNEVMLKKCLTIQGYYNTTTIEEYKENQIQVRQVNSNIL